MSKQRKISFIAFLLTIVLLFIFIVDYLLNQDKKEKIYNIAYISDTSKSEELRVISEGINQAAKDNKVEVKSYTLSGENDIDNQIELIKREVKDKVDAIILVPTDSNKLRDVILDIYKDIPIVLINSKIDDCDSLPLISCDNRKLGQEIAMELIRNGNTRSKIGILTTNKEKSNQQDMYKGFIDEISITKNTFKKLNLEGDIKTYYEKINKFINNDKIDLLVTFEKDILEIASQVKKDNNLDIELYGVGRSNKILSFLEEDIISSIAVQNEFNIGYLGVKMAVDKLSNNDTSSKTIDFSIINKRNMYWDSNQKILFPFIK